MKFAQPQFLWILLLALPLLAAFFYWSWRVKQKLIAQFVQARLLPTLTVGVSPARQKFRLALLAAAVAGVLAALAGPQWGFAWEEATQRGLDIIVAVDTSRSMLAADAAPNRLEKAKLAAFDLMRQAKEDRLGLIAFAGTAFLQCPLTLDEEAFRQSVAALNVGIIPQGGTALSEAIRTAQGAFEKGNNNHKVLILFTDGEDHDADVETLGAAKEAAEAGLNIFTVGVGTAAGELLRVPDEKGNMVFVKDEDGNVVKSHLNEPLLEQIATAAGGFYLPLLGANPMETLYSRGLAPLPKSESTTKLTRVYHERYHWFLGFAIVCLVAELLLPERVRSRRAETTGAVAHPGLGKAAAVLSLFLLPALASASTPGAFNKYQSGDYQGAFDEYNRLAGEKTNDYRLHYNAGTAAYRAQQLDDAEKQLGAALNSPDIAADLPTQEHAYFNLGNTLYHQGEPASDPKKKQERWEQAIANYSHALQLNTNDADARNNLAFVKKKLEELKQQQQQSQNQKDQKDQNQDKQQDQQQKNQDQKNQDQKNQQDKQDQQQKSAQQNQKDQKDKQDQQKQSQAEKSDPDKQKQDQQKQQQAQKDKDQQNKSSEVKPGGDDQRDKQPDQNQQGVSAIPAQMTRQQAQQMLDAQKDDEKALIFAPENPPVKTTSGKIKDW
jgi:Ca-activated chloride channel family protein